jgi:iron(III) transport system ATP-binding protein
VLGSLPDGAELDLLVQADRLDLVADADGCTVRDVHPMGSVTRVLLEGSGGVQITVETIAPVVGGQAYRVVPQSGSVRAFAHT